ncbi:monooxygenase [Streptomyces sp. NBC_00162]|uniref:monooxygenase n=1 Tax=Streptomyces sp. NBC_00162 TaxID=2903629 RepID=UPI00214C2AF2|nr:monooxygenase [Streptomyces sp. NBC_00162]UUU44207.1 monooxygenase [Streptomyces sp. NBC_00162]
MDTDVLVVGAGPTGLMLAAELALAGVRVRVVERRDERQRDSRALSLHPRSIELMDQRGIADRFLALGRTVPGWHFAGLDTRLDFTGLDTRHPYSLFLAQSRTEELLELRARELGAEIRRGWEAVGLRQDENGVELRLNGAGGTESVSARYVVGCDGGRSFVRRAAGIDFPGTDETLTGMLGDFRTMDPLAVNRARAHGVLVAPLEDGLTRLVYIDPERMRVPAAEPVTLEEFRTSLVRICGTDCAVADPRWLSRFGNATRLAARYRAGRVLLAGDAAHIHFPAAGQGLNTGLQDAVNLGWKLAAEIHGWALAGLLDSYHDERHPVGRAVTENTEVQTLLMELTLLTPYQGPAAALRRLLDGLLGVEEVNRRLAGMVTALDTHYPAPAEGADLLVGRRVPDIGLTVPGAAAARVYELLHEGRPLHLDLTRDRASYQDPGAAHITAVAPLDHGRHPELAGVTELLVRPDGHIAWATRATDTRTRREDRAEALAAWGGSAA